MAEQDPSTPFSQKAIDLAWEAATASNEALDSVKAASATISDAVIEVECEGYPQDVIPADMAVNGLHKLSEALSNYYVLCDMAAPMMLTPDSPFNTAAISADVSTPETANV